MVRLCKYKYIKSFQFIQTKTSYDLILNVFQLQVLIWIASGQIGSSRMRFDRPANGMVKVSWLTDTGCLPVAGTDLDSIWIIGWTIVK